MSGPTAQPGRLVQVARPLAGCAVVTLDRPQAMNALSHALRRDLVQAIDSIAADGATRVLVLTGAGRAFCAGLDLKELGSGASGQVLGMEREALDPVAALARFPGPVIGAINGAAITGGFELALACDVLVASPEARFADTHVRVGVMPGWGLSQKLPRIIGSGRARLASFTGRFITAAQALDWGLVQAVVEPAALLDTAVAWAGEMLDGVPQTLLGYRRVMDEGMAMSLGDALVHERRVATESQHRIDPAAVEARRAAVRARGQQQLKG